ncbi:MAG: NUDIX hydrolase [SAR324 cluster bacterium]|nr:NUDIX hydrolase [SAR324 cluster bacterium]
MPENHKKSKTIVYPKDAATLLIVRKDQGTPRVLMGQRHGKLKFMPNKFVFPGGRVDAGDSRVSSLSELKDGVKKKLLRNCSEARARGLAMAAIRETFEEAGLIVGKPHHDRCRTRSKSWLPFFSEGFAPTLEPLDLVARAITPPNRFRRFDARFFSVDACHVHGLDQPHLTGSGELLKLHWVAFDEAEKLELPQITHFVLQEVERRIGASSDQLKKMPIPFVHTRNEQFYYDTIQ